MIKRIYCPLCDKRHFVEEVARSEYIIVKDQPTQCLLKYYKCKKAPCDNEYADGRLLNKNLKAARRMQMKKKIKKPKHGPFHYYCYECEHWRFDREAGAAILGVCEAIPMGETEQDAYSKPCALWRWRHDD